MFDPNKEAENYKNIPTKELKKVLKAYKHLSKSNSDIYNFLFTFIIMIFSAFIFMKLTTGTLLFLLVVHYLFFWEYLHKYKKFKLVSDEEKEEIDQVIKILEKYLEDRKTKNPSE